MKITVIGAGAMGSLFGGLLAEAGEEVWLVDVWAEHVSALSSGGLTVERGGAVRSIPVRATTDPAEPPPADLALVFVKATQTRAAAETARALLAGTGLVLTLQNGLGNAEGIAEIVGKGRVLAGTTAHGATLLGPGRIRHAGLGPTVVGPWGGGDVAPSGKVAETFTRAGIETRAVRDPAPELWAKLLVNVGINAVTALTGVRNGEILDLESTRDLVRAAVEEAAAVAAAGRIPVRPDAVEHVFQVARATAANRSSMGQDVDRRRPTEISVINGAVVREGGRLGIPTPVNRALTALVETLEGHYPRGG